MTHRALGWQQKSFISWWTDGWSRPSSDPTAPLLTSKVRRTSARLKTSDVSDLNYVTDVCFILCHLKASLLCDRIISCSWMFCRFCRWGRAPCGSDSCSGLRTVMTRPSTFRDDRKETGWFKVLSPNCQCRNIWTSSPHHFCSHQRPQTKQEVLLIQSSAGVVLSRPRDRIQTSWNVLRGIWSL